MLILNEDKPRPESLGYPNLLSDIVHNHPSLKDKESTTLDFFGLNGRIRRLFWMYAFKIFSFEISCVKFSRRNFLLLLSHKLVLPSEVGVWLWELLFTVGSPWGRQRKKSLMAMLVSNNTQILK